MRPAKIVVAGYPRSGNTWMSRLLGDVLDSPVGGGHGAKPLCTEGQERTGAYPVQQLHIRPDYKHEEDGAYKISVKAYDGDPKIVYVVRDPRDVAISVMYYWNLSGVDAALDTLINGHHPLGVHGPWARNINDWLDSPLPFVLVQYEELFRNAELVMYSVLYELEQLFKEKDQKFRYSGKRLAEAVARQEFSAKKKQIEKDGDGRPYGKTIQQKHLRKGIVGDWENHFNVEQEELAREHFSAAAERLGYTL
jgi:hypothetical protein